MTKEELLIELKKIGVENFDDDIAVFECIMADRKIKLANNTHIPGVYMWINKNNNKKYVGVSKNIYRRIKEEIVDFNNNKSMGLTKLFYGVKKHGLENFEVRLLLTIEEDKFYELEKIFIKYYDSVNNGYNIKFGGKHNYVIKVSEERKAELRKWWTTEKRNEYSKKTKEYFKTHDHPRQLNVKLYSPKNELTEINNIRRFCKTHDLCRKLLREVINGERIHYKGWHLINDPNFTYVEVKKVVYNSVLHKLLSPDNVLHEFRSIVKFCRQHNLNRSCIKKVLKKRNTHYKQWRLPTTNLIIKNLQFQLSTGEIIKITNKTEFCKKFGFKCGDINYFLRTRKVGDKFNDLILIANDFSVNYPPPLIS